MVGKLVLGTRGSDLARAQSRLVEEALLAKWDGLKIETTIIKTSGDEGKGDVAIADARAGRKGLFTAEIERALINREIDLAVHSAKDLPSGTAAGTRIAAVLPRAPVNDVLVSVSNYNLDSLPKSGRVATGSIRRRHQLRWQRPDLEVVDLRGNVPNRLRKIAGNEWHGGVLARAGLERLGVSLEAGSFTYDNRHFHATSLSEEIFMPAGGQGVIAVQARKRDNGVEVLCDAINDFDTGLCLRAEREFLRRLNADCNQPVAVYATLNGGTMKVRAQIFVPGEIAPRRGSVEGPGNDPEKLGAELLRQING